MGYLSYLESELTSWAMLNSVPVVIFPDSELGFQASYGCFSTVYTPQLKSQKTGMKQLNGKIFNWGNLTSSQRATCKLANKPGRSKQFDCCVPSRTFRRVHSSPGSFTETKGKYSCLLSCQPNNYLPQMVLQLLLLACLGETANPYSNSQQPSTPAHPHQTEKKKLDPEMH